MVHNLELTTDELWALLSADPGITDSLSNSRVQLDKHAKRISVTKEGDIKVYGIAPDYHKRLLESRGAASVKTLTDGDELIIVSIRDYTSINSGF